MASRASETPVFGPQVTPQLFEERWYDNIEAVIMKFQHVATTFNQNRTITQAHERTEEICTMTSLWVQTAIFCEREKQALDLTADPQAPNPIYAAEPAGFRSVYELLDSLRMMANGRVLHWKSAKAGQELIEKRLRWQEVPLALRRRMNGIIEEVEMAKQAGEWSPDTSQEAYDEQARHRGWQ